MSELSNSTRYILVTGSDGLLGWHTRVFLSTEPAVTVIPCNRQQFADDEYLHDALSRAHAVIHLAGVNRGTDDDIRTNVDIADRLIAACEKTDSRPHVLYSNTTHCDRDSVYGKSKQAVADHLASWAEREDARFCNFVLPHIFGEHGQPMYNSVTSTFCHQIANGHEPTLTGDGDLELLHAQEAVQAFWSAIQEGLVGTARPNGVPMKVSELLARIQSLAERYESGVTPNLDDPFDLRLFNTYRSYIPHEQRPKDLQVWADERGDLFEAIRADGQGQVFLSTTKPGITRGEHFHFNKVERFLVVQGQAKIRVRRVLHDDLHVFDVRGDAPQAIDIPTLHTHNITNVGDTTLLTLFWAGEHFDRENPDTFACLVEPGQSIEVSTQA